MIVQRIVVAGILKRRGKILLVQRGAREKVFPNLWELPSGKKEWGEDVTRALTREFLEEIGLRIKLVRPLSVFDYTIHKGNKYRETTQINFLVRLARNGQHPRLSREHQAYAWVNQQRIKDRYISESTRRVINEAFHTN